MSNIINLGTQLSKTASGLVNGSYVFQTDPCLPAAFARMRAFVYMTADASSVISDVKIQAEGSYDGTKYDPIPGTKADTEGASGLLENDYSSMPSVGTTKLLGIIDFDPFGYVGGIKFGAKVTGAPATLDNISIKVVAGFNAGVGSKSAGGGFANPATATLDMGTHDITGVTNIKGVAAAGVQINASNSGTGGVDGDSIGLGTAGTTFGVFVNVANTFDVQCGSGTISLGGGNETISMFGGGGTVQGASGSITNFAQLKAFLQSMGMIGP